MAKLLFGSEMVLLGAWALVAAEEIVLLRQEGQLQGGGLRVPSLPL